MSVLPLTIQIQLCVLPFYFKHDFKVFGICMANRGQHLIQPPRPPRRGSAIHPSCARGIHSLPVDAEWWIYRTKRKPGLKVKTLEKYGKRITKHDISNYATGTSN